MCDFAPPDTVGYTGIYDAAAKAVTATDKAVGTNYDACEKARYALKIIVDHGNADQMINLAETDAPHTAHMSEQGFYYLDRKGTQVRHG